MKAKWFLVDILIFVALAIILGIIIDLIFPEPDDTEEMRVTFFLLFSQIFVDSIIVYFLGFGYEKLVNRDPDLYYGFTLFIVLFFLVQLQLLNRLKRFYLFFFPDLEI